METLAIAANLVVNLWLLIIAHRQCVRKQLPWFASYVAWVVASGSFGLAIWLLGRQLYGSLYWGMEAVEVTLIVAAVRESFLRIFQGFTAIRGFRWSVWSVISGVVIYSVWKAVHAPPLQASRLGAFVAGAEFLFRWGIAGIALLTAFLGVRMHEPMDTREHAVVTGFGIASLAFVLYIGSFSVFPTKYIFMFKYLPTVGYFLAAFWWIWVFSRPVKNLGLKDLGIGSDTRQ